MRKRQLLSPDRAYQLNVFETQNVSESGPVTYHCSDYSLEVIRVSDRSIVLQRSTTRYWNDGEAPQQGGIEDWTFSGDSQSIHLLFEDGTVEKLEIP